MWICRYTYVVVLGFAIGFILKYRNKTDAIVPLVWDLSLPYNDPCLYDISIIIIVYRRALHSSVNTRLLVLLGHFSITARGDASRSLMVE